MRYAFAIAGLAVAAQAGGNTYTLTATEEVTITSCAPTHTNCPYKSASNDWENWNKPADPTTTATWGSWDPSKASATPKKSSSTWADWDPSKPSTTTKPNGGDWNNWNNGNGADGKKTTTWGSWDPSKPSSAAGEWNNWNNGNGADGKKTTSGKPATATGANGDWNNWGNGVDASSKPATATGANGDWNNWGSSSTKPASNTAACPSYTATAPPAWFSQLPSAVLSSLAAQWTGAPPKDWCYYSYSASNFATKTPDAASTTGNGAWNNWGSATATPVMGTSTSSNGAWNNWGSATGTGPVAKYTGAANANAASFVLGGAAAIAAIVLV